MTEIQNPGTPRTDELARNAARNALAYGVLREDAGVRRGLELADAVIDEHTVTWETDVNEAGVPVRRYVLRGAWEVDPEGLQSALAIPPVPGAGATVRFTKGADVVTEWTVNETGKGRSGMIYLRLSSPAGELQGVAFDEVEIVAPPIAHPHDVVIFTDGRDGGREWTVGRGPATRWVNITSISPSGYVDVLCAAVADLTVVRRP